MDTAIEGTGQLLNGWKEIATYLGRGVRTAQRLETELRLPVRRPRGKQRSAVFAIRSELDLWLKSHAFPRRNGHSAGPVPQHLADRRARCEELISRSRDLRNRITYLCVQVMDMHARIATNVLRCNSRLTLTMSLLEEPSRKARASVLKQRSEPLAQAAAAETGISPPALLSEQPSLKS